MRDVFFTILAVWVVYRIWNGIQSVNTRAGNNPGPGPARKDGSVSVDYIPPKQKNKNDDDGEYVDYEEIK